MYLKNGLNKKFFNIKNNFSIKFRSHSLPSSFAFCIRHESKESKLYSSEKIYADKFSFSNPLKKNSLTLGQRNLPLSFRDYDHVCL